MPLTFKSTSAAERFILRLTNALEKLALATGLVLSLITLLLFPFTTARDGLTKALCIIFGVVGTTYFASSLWPGRSWRLDFVAAKLSGLMAFVWGLFMVAVGVSSLFVSSRIPGWGQVFLIGSGALLLVISRSLFRSFWKP